MTFDKKFKGVTTAVVLSLILVMVISPGNFAIFNLASADVTTGTDKAGSLNQAALPGKGVISTIQTSTGPANTLQVNKTVTVSQISSAAQVASNAQVNKTGVKVIPFYSGPLNISPQSLTKTSPNVVSVNIIQSSSAGPLIANQYSGFEGSAYPASCFCTPPDGNLAVGPNHIFQMVNLEGKIWSKTGTLLETIPMSSFFGTGSLFISDPRVVYDAQSGHWFASILATDFIHNGNVLIAVSQTSNPTGAWWVYNPTFANVIPDQPRLAVTDDKVTIAASDYPASGGWTGDEIWVLQKSTMIVGGGTPFSVLGPDITRFHIEPAIYPVAGQTDQWLVQDGAGGATGAEYLKISGLPGSLTYTSMFVTPIATTNAPPGGHQAGTSTLVATNDARILSASMRGTVITWTGNDACTPSLDSTTRSCVRWDSASISGSGSLLQDIDFGQVGKDLYFPAVSQDAPGSFGVIFDFSSVTEYPSIGFTGQSSGEPFSTVDNPVLVKAGTGPDTTGRHGDYHSIRADPSTGLYYSEAEYNTKVLPWNTYISINGISTGIPSVHPTTLTLNSLGNVPWGFPTAIRGKLIDTTTGVGIAGQPITLTTSAGTIFNSVTVADGTFVTSGTAPTAPPVSGITVQASYAGTQFFGPSSSAVGTYNTFKHNTAVYLFNPVPLKQPWGQPATLTASLFDTTSGFLALATKTIIFNGTGVPTSPTGVTNNHGYATISIITRNTTGVWPVQARFAGDANYSLSALSAIQPYTTLKHPTTLVLWSPLNVTRSTAVTFGTTLLDIVTNTPVSGTTVTFTGTGVVGAPINGLTNANGDKIIPDTAPTTAGTWTVKSTFAGTGQFSPSSSITKSYNTS